MPVTGGKVKRAALKGKCKKCGCKMNRFLGEDDRKKYEKMLSEGKPITGVMHRCFKCKDNREMSECSLN